jgi:hypothetical protein
MLPLQRWNVCGSSNSSRQQLRDVRAASVDVDSAWLWQLVDVLMPELYISKDNGGMFIRGTLTEAGKCRQASVKY